MEKLNVWLLQPARLIEKGALEARFINKHLKLGELD